MSITLDVIAQLNESSLRDVSDQARGFFGDLGQSIGGVTDMFGGAETGALSFGSALGSAGLLAGGAAIAGIGALATGIAAATRELYDLGSQWDDTFDAIQIKTGATGDVLDSLKDSVKAVGAEVPESIGTIGDIMAGVHQQLDLTGPALEQVTTTLGNLAHMGQEIDERDLGRVFRGFHVAAEDMVPTLDLLNAFSQQTGIGIDEMLGVLGDSGPQLRQMGMDVDDALSLFTNLNRAGLDPASFAQPLTKALKELADAGVNDAKAGLGQVITEIDRLIDAGQEAKALDFANEVFGGRGGLRVFDAIKNDALTVESLNSQLANTGPTIAQLADDTYDWSEQWDILRNKFEIALEPLASGVFDAVNDQLGKVADWAEQHPDDLIDIFTSAAEGAVLFGQAIAATVEVGIRGFGLVFDVVSYLQQIFGDTVATVSGLAGDFLDAIGMDDQAAQLRVVEKVASAWSDANDLISQKIDGAADSVGGFNDQLTALRNTIEQVGDTAKSSPIGIDVFGTGTLGRPSADPATGTPAGPPVSGWTGAPLPGESPRDFAHRAMMPYWQSQGLTVGDHAADQFGEHQNGALDIMVPDIATGKQVLQQALADPNVYGAIFNNQTYGYGSPTPQDYTAGHTGDPTQDHQDHVHVWYKPGAGGPGGPPSDALSFNSGPSAFPGYAAGPAGSTPGYNEYGEPGYYRPDQRQITQADRRVQDSQDRVADANERLADAVDKRAELTMLATEDERRSADRAVERAQKARDRAVEDAEQAVADAADARQGRFTAARRGSSGGLGQIGSPLDADFGLSGGLPGLADNLVRFVASLAMAPMLGQLSAISSVSGDQGSGLIGMARARGGGGIPGLPGLPGIPSLGGPAAMPGGPAASVVGGRPMGAGVGGGGGFSGVGGAPLAAINTAASGLDVLAPGAGAAAQMGIQLINRAIGYGGQMAGIGVGGLLETFMLNDSALADPSRNWIGRIASGFAGARPAGDNTAGQAPQPVSAQQAAAQGQNPQGMGGQLGKGDGGGTTINYNNYSPVKTEDRMGADLARHTTTTNMAPGQR